MMNAIHTTRLLAGLAGIAFAAGIAPAAYAINANAPTSRAEVREQTRAANKSGQLAAGEEDMANKAPMPAPSKTREQRKAETLAANKNGGLGSPGQSSYKTYNVSQREQLARSTKSSVEGKAETMQAVKGHSMMGAGEAGMPAKN